MLTVSSLLIAPILFFGLGFFSHAVRSDLKLPSDITKALSVYLLAGIGLHGGAELAQVGLGTALHAVAAALLLGFSLPLVGYALLRRACGMRPGRCRGRGRRSVTGQRPPAPVSGSALRSAPGGAECPFPAAR